MPERLSGFRVIVTGSRHISHSRTLSRRLAQIVEQHENVTLLHGGAEGIDHDAVEFAKDAAWKIAEFKADWDKYGKAAGPRRNQQMVDAGADLCLAFPDDRSIGTWDCVRRARAAGIPVEVIYV